MQGVSSLSSDAAFLKTVGGLSVKQLPFKFAVIFFVDWILQANINCLTLKGIFFKDGKSRKKGYSEWFKLSV